MSVRRTNATTKKINRGSSIPENNKKIKPNPTQTKKTQNKDSKIIDKKRNIKVDYNSNNYFCNEEEDYYNDYIYNKMDYYDRNQKSHKYNNETNDSYVTVEHEDGHINYFPKNYVEYKGASPPLYNNKNIQYYENENSEDSENNYNNENDNMYYENENEDEYEPEVNQYPVKGYNQYKGINKYYLTQDNNENNNKMKRNNQNVISRPINHQINFTKDMKRKGRTPGGNVHNCGNNTTTTNNTYNNNIYYINPINVKNKNKKEEINNKVKRAATNKKNSVYKNVDITIDKKKPKEKDYFKINNIERSKRQKYINAAILIQSIFRGYLIKIKLYNNVNLYVCCKRSIDILEKIIFKRKRYYWRIYKNSISNMFYNDLLNSKVSLNILKEYLKTNKNDNAKERKKVTSFHKELGDSFNIVVDRKQKENNEKKLKSKLNDVIKENKELKNQLSDNKNIEEKMKNLIDENKKNQNINAIIMKDNQQLAKKLKDIQDYRNTNLFVENQPSVDLTQKQQMQIEELILNNEININKLKKYLLGKIINKKINTDKYIIKDYFNKYKNIVEKIINKDIKKYIYLKNSLNNIENKFKLIKQKYFWNIYYEGLILNNDTISKNKSKADFLKKAINNKEKNIKMILYKNFFKYYSNTIQLNKEETQKEEEEEENEQDKELYKKEILKKIFKNYQKNIKLIYKIFIEKWNLKSKIMGMRAAARDKKKKRKLKKKNNKLLYEKHFGIAEKKPVASNLGPQLCKSIHEFSYIVSNGAVIKESSSNENAEMIKNKNSSTSSDKINKTKNKLDKKNNLGIKKTNSLNEIATQNKLKKDSKEDNKENENININEESEEDSGDSFGLEDNNSD